MKQSVYIFLLLLNVQNLLSQEVKVDLSLSWSKSKLSVSAEYDTISHPYLFVKYSNLTQDSIYMPRTIYGCNELPLVLSWEFSFNNIAYKNGFNYISKNNMSTRNEVEDSERYVFLNPGETFTDRFNLVSFMILRGEYLFYYDKIPCNTIIMEGDQRTFCFPDIKNGYRLYCGNVVPDTLSVTF